MNGSVTGPHLPALSKRAARRLIQRAFVLAGRSRNVRQHIREARLGSVWEIADWGLAWDLALNRGKIELDRRLSKQPRIRFVWPTAGQFFADIESDGPGLVAETLASEPGLRRWIEPVYQAFRKELQALLTNPVDEDGTWLL